MPADPPGTRASAATAPEHARAVAQKQSGWTLRAVDPATRTIEGTATTRMFHFRDDFVIRVTQSGDGAVVDMRSKSRDGKGDLGANAKRIQSFLDQVAQDVRANPGAPGTAGH